MDIITIARDLGKAIQQDERFIRMVSAQQVADEDIELQENIRSFNEKRVTINAEVGKQDKDMEKITALNKEVNVIYSEIMSNANMINYTDAKKELDDAVEFVIQILRGSIAGQDPDKIEKQEACGGDCSGCSGCA